MSKLRALAGTLKTFWQLTKADWQETDHKLLRIAGGIAAFVLMALFWLYFFSWTSPLKLFG